MANFQLLVFDLVKHVKYIKAVTISNVAMTQQLLWRIHKLSCSIDITSVPRVVVCGLHTSMLILWQAAHPLYLPYMFTLNCTHFLLPAQRMGMSAKLVSC